MAQVRETKIDDAPEEKTIPNLMTRVRMEHELESLRRDRERVEHTIGQMELDSERKQQPVHEPLLVELQSEIRGINDKIEERIKQLQDLNKGVNPEKQKPERKIGQ